VVFYSDTKLSFNLLFSVSIKDLKPFIQQKLQFKITSKAIQSVAEVLIEQNIFLVVEDQPFSGKNGV